jgi:hypothetical protein
MPPFGLNVGGPVARPVEDRPAAWAGGAAGSVRDEVAIGRVLRARRISAPPTAADVVEGRADAVG